MDQMNEAVGRIEAAVNLVGADQARLNVTYSGSNGDLPDLINKDASDADIKRWATEAIQAGSVPGIPADPDANFNDFVVDRFSPTEARPFSVVFLRPKTPFGNV
jgi:hypothetical protein